ncbi:MAG: hypothetical protein PHX63_07430, partial [Eubacteriales bacterium]|nr:hypothetical protein [Eubacteriales bacterium]
MREILERIRIGQRIQKSELDDAVERLDSLIGDAEKGNRLAAAKRLRKTRRSLTDYKEIYQKRHKK